MFTARDLLNTTLNTSFSGSDVDDNNGDRCKTGGCGSLVTVESLLIVEILVTVESLVIVDTLVVVRLVV